MEPQFDLRPAAYAVIRDADRVLLAHWTGRGGHWTLPGGGMDPGEHPGDGAVREVFEETGFHVVLDRLLGVDSHVIAPEDRLRATGRAQQSLRIVYEAHIVGGELRDEVDGTTDTAAWFRLDEIPHLPRVSLVDAALAMLEDAHPLRPAPPPSAG